MNAVIKYGLIFWAGRFLTAIVASVTWFYSSVTVMQFFFFTFDRKRLYVGSSGILTPVVGDALYILITWNHRATQIPLTRYIQRRMCPYSIGVIYRVVTVFFSLVGIPILGIATGRVIMTRGEGAGGEDFSF